MKGDEMREPAISGMVHKELELSKEQVLRLRNLRLERQVAELTIDKCRMVLADLERREREQAEELRRQLGGVRGEIGIDLDERRAFLRTPSQKSTSSSQEDING